MKFSALIVMCLSLALPTGAQENETWRSWNQPVEPFRIAGNLYYVGASDITSFLITTPEGHVVIDGGFPETAPLIRDSIVKLGYALEDVKILLTNHAHFDHAGGLAALKQWTGAELWVSEGDAGVVEAGGAGDHLLSAADNSFPAVAVDRRLSDGDSVTLGGTTLTAHLTAGHTRGCTSYSLRVDDGGETLDVVSVCSLTVLQGVELIDNATFPEVADAFAASFERLETLPCDVFLSSHGSFFDLTRKREALAAGRPDPGRPDPGRPDPGRPDPGRPDPGGANPFVDPEGYRAYLERAKRRYLERLAEQQSAPSDGAKTTPKGVARPGSGPQTRPQ